MAVRTTAIADDMRPLLNDLVHMLWPIVADQTGYAIGDTPWRIDIEKDRVRLTVAFDLIMPDDEEATHP